MALQGLLLALVVVAGVIGRRWPGAWGGWLWVLAGVLALAAALLALGGALHLGGQLTPFPKPAVRGTLKQGGVYQLVRHPIYGGVLLFSLAWSLATSPVALVPGGLLALLFEGKSRREEAWLVEDHPGYDDYRRRVPRRFVPFVW